MANTQITAEDFRNCNLSQIITNENEDYWQLQRALLALGKQNSDAEILILFADICSMGFNIESRNEPFRPSTVMADGRRSAIPDDFNVKEARNYVGGRDSFNALLALKDIYRIEIKRIREYNNKPKANFLSAYFFPTSVRLANDGRVVAKADNNEFDIINSYTMEIASVANSIIFLALDLIQQEHRIQEIDFYLWVEQSPYILKDRITLIAKALYAGYDNDFAIALHLLVPQIEHFVRVQLKQAGEHTTYLDKTGIETENGLSSLMENPRVNEIFGEDLAFELKALFCDPLGANLRNELAHGLINYEESQFSVFSIYAWWLMLRIAFKHF